MSDKDVYKRLIEWLNKAWWGLPESEHLMPTIMSFYTPEEAALLTGIPFSGRSLEELAGEELRIIIPPGGKWLIGRAVDLYRLWREEVVHQPGFDLTVRAEKEK